MKPVYMPTAERNDAAAHVYVVCSRVASGTDAPVHLWPLLLLSVETLQFVKAYEYVQQGSTRRPYAQVAHATTEAVFVATSA